MTADQGAVLAVLAVTMGLFLWGRWRYDLVAVLALLALVALGVVPAERAFAGFGHPAVVTVAAVLLISEALRNTGVVDHLVRLLAHARRHRTGHVAAAAGLTACLSAFMNNIGALALMLPAALRNAYRAGRPPSQVLMPLSFASLLGGLVTLIGTPPNIVIASVRQQASGVPFGMFDFTPVGLVVAVAGVLFVSTVGWRLLRHQMPSKSAGQELFQIEAYMTEARVPAGSILAGAPLRAIDDISDSEVAVMAILRGEHRRLAPSASERLRAGDTLILEGDPSALEQAIDGVTLEHAGGEPPTAKALGSDDVRIVEAVLMPNSPIEGQSIRGLRMHDRYGINLLAVARQGKAPITRLKHVRFRTGDVLLLQGEKKTTQQVLTALGCLPLADRGLTFGRRRRVLLPLAVFGAAVVAAATGAVQVQIAFVTAVVALILLRALSLQEVYRKIEWPVLVLLGALLPLGEALRATGGTALIAAAVISLAGMLPVWAMLALIIAVSMLLSDLVHNTPTAVIMGPVGVSIATQLALPIEPFLMAVAVGSASPYLTPIGHQSNTLVMAPGGYRFGDYWRMGLPLDVIILAVAVPMILWVWL